MSDSNFFQLSRIRIQRKKCWILIPDILSRHKIEKIDKIHMCIQVRSGKQKSLQHDPHHCIVFKTACMLFILLFTFYTFIYFLGMFIAGDYQYSFINFLGVNISVVGSLIYTKGNAGYPSSYTPKVMPDIQPHIHQR